MQFKTSLVQGVFLKRYKRFFADVDLNGKIEKAHVPNTGSLKSCSTPGNPCLVSKADDPKRTLSYTLEAIQADEGSWVGVNTGWPNKLVVEGFKEKKWETWSRYDHFQTEVKINEGTRLDLVLWEKKYLSDTKLQQGLFVQGMPPFHCIEIKNVTLRQGRGACFPDAVTERGQKHLRELCHLMKLGATAEMVFVVQRNDVDFFRPAFEIDPVYAELLKKAQGEGLVVTALAYEVSPDGIKWVRSLPIHLLEKAGVWR